MSHDRDDPLLHSGPTLEFRHLSDIGPKVIYSCHGLGVLMAKPAPPKNDIITQPSETPIVVDLIQRLVLACGVLGASRFSRGHLKCYY